MDDDDLFHWMMSTTFDDLWSIPAPDWMLEAVCATADPAAFFPELGCTATAALRMCEACPVQRECLEFAMAEEQGTARYERYGMWGGLSPNQRHALELERRQSHESVAA